MVFNFLQYHQYVGTVHQLMQLYQSVFGRGEITAVLQLQLKL